MKAFKDAAPVQREVMDLVQGSPLPWTVEMIRTWTGLTKHRTSHLLQAMKSAGRIWMMEHGVYTSMDRYVPPPEPLESTVKYERHILTDDMMARYGFNL